MPDPLEEFQRAVGQGIVDGLKRVKWFILFAVVVLVGTMVMFVPIYYALGWGAGF